LRIAEACKNYKQFSSQDVMHTGKESNRWNVLHLSFSAYAWVYVCTQKPPCT